MKNAIVLCSGGLDSVTTAYYAKKKLGYKINILFFDYGQRSLIVERRLAKKCAVDLDGRFIEVKLDKVLKSDLTSSRKKFKKISRADLRNTKKESLKWYFPFRNSIFLSYALGLAESFYLKDKKVSDIFVGFKNDGKESFPDTSASYVRAVNTLARFGVRRFRVFAPLIKRDKEDIVLIGQKLNVDFRNTFSCYTSSKLHCGSCLACRLRQEGFYWANVEDPTVYKEKAGDFRSGEK